MTEVYVTVRYTGEIVFKITANGSSWEDITLTTATRTKHTFETSGTVVMLAATGTPGAQIASTKKTSGQFNKPGIRIEVTSST